jgi:hypothetical protein
MNEEVAKVESVPEEEPKSVEVGFDICGITQSPSFSSTKASLGYI